MWAADNIVGTKFVTAFSEKPLEQRRRADQNIATLRAARIHELMRDTTRQEDTLSRRQARGIALDHCRQFALDDVDSFVVVCVHMDRGPGVPVAGVFEEKINKITRAL
jgi:hypothetical protein